jgi:hypothetical protein
VKSLLVTASRAADITPEESGTEEEESEEEIVPVRRATKSSGGQVSEATLGSSLNNF